MMNNRAFYQNKGRALAIPARSVRDCALSILERSDRTEQELRRKLHERGYEEKDIDGVITFLKEYGYVNDAVYAERYARTCSSRKSIRQIRFDLERKGIARESIDAALEDTEVDEEMQVRAFLLKKGCCPGKRIDTAVCRRLTASLSRKGFSYEVIRSVMERLCEETD